MSQERRKLLRCTNPSCSVGIWVEDHEENICLKCGSPAKIVKEIETESGPL